MTGRSKPIDGGWLFACPLAGSEKKLRQSTCVKSRIGCVNDAQSAPSEPEVGFRALSKSRGHFRHADVSCNRR